MTCENCIHNNLIKTEASSFCLCSRAFEMTERRKYDPDIECEYFMDRSKVIFLPVNVGDTVYYITGIGHNLVKPARVKEIILGKNGISYLYVAGDGYNFEASFDTFYLSRKEAEQKIKKNNKAESTKCENCKFFFKETMTCLNTDFCDYEEGCEKYDK